MANQKRLASGLGGLLRLLTAAISLAMVSVFALALVPCVVPVKAEVVVGDESRHPNGQWYWWDGQSFWMDQVRVDPVAKEVYFVPGDDRFELRVNTEVSALFDRIALASLAKLPQSKVPAWAATAHLRERPLIPITSKPALYWREDGFGLPLRCLSTTWLQSALLPTFVNEHGVTAKGVRGVSGPVGATTNCIPTRIYWPHFLADVGVHAAGWSLILVIASMIRAGLRRLRGFCPRCAYNLRGNPSQGCPECGWRRG